MKEYEQMLIAGFIMLGIAVILLMYANSIDIPSAYKTFLGIPYQFNSQYTQAYGQLLSSILVSFLILGTGIGTLLYSYVVKFMEDKLEQANTQLLKLEHKSIQANTQQLRSDNMEKKYCRYCGAEYSKNTVSCERCGKKITD